MTALIDRRTSWSEEEDCCEDDSVLKEDDSGFFTPALSLDILFCQKPTRGTQPALDVSETTFAWGDDSSSDEDIDLLASRHAPESLKKINVTWNEKYPTDGVRRCSSSTNKVSFAPEPHFLTVHTVGTEERNGNWHHVIRERENFESRILELEKNFEPSLEGQPQKKSHRTKDSREEGSCSLISIAINGEMKLPLLKVTACADSNDDLGDFSAVQRETEILRSYRKPQPPKHRAKQTRAPRHMKNGNESSDIFTELSEEDLKNENISDKENIASYDDAGRSMLRSHSEDKPKSPREARSSMFADIEQTLAALYMSDESEVVQPVDSAPPEHKTGTTKPVPEVSVDNHGEKTDMNPEPYAGDFVVSENTISSTSQALISSEIKTESAPISLASSPKLNHTVSPKTGPKVSPKPSPKASARASSNNARTCANAPVTKHKDAHESISVSVSESAENESSLDPAVISFKCAVSQEELNTTDIGVPEETSSCMQTILKTSDETSTITEVEKPLDSIGSDILSIATDTITISKEGFISESTMIGSNDDKPETVQISVMTKSSEKPITYNMSDEDTTTEISRGNTTKSVNEEGEADFASQEQSESLTLVLDSKEQINTQSDANEVNKTMPASVAQGAKPLAIEQDEAIEQDTQQSATGTVLTDGSPQEDEKQKESSEDQTGKGKISKIPVRAGAAD